MAVLMSLATLPRQLSVWAARAGLRNKLAILLVAMATASSLATYAALTQTPFFGNDPTTVTILLTLDLVFLLLLGTLVGQRVLSIWMKRRRNQAGSRLHVRMVGVFTLLAVAPALLVAMFAAVFFYFGVEAWFSERVRTALDESQEVAQAYLKEHQQVLRADALAMANDLNRQSFLVAEDPVRFAQMVSAQAYLRSLTEVIVFDGSGKILARSGLTFALSFEPISDEMRERANQGEVVLMVDDKEGRVRALLRLDNFVDTYLFVGRLIEARVLDHMEATQKAVSDYNDLKDHSSGIRIMITLIFVVVALLLLLVAVWFGLNFANRLVRPISELISAADRVRAGDLTARVNEMADQGEDEISQLSRAFNRMTHQLETQRSDLVDANRLLDTRRRFTEAVLSGVSAGVIGLDAGFKINLLNPQAMQFFQITSAEALHGQPLKVLAPEIAPLVESMQTTTRLKDEHIEIRRAGQPLRTLLVRCTSDIQGGDVRGYVVTFDDVSELVMAQRKAAWADVARRIAHEIKNPLTPIQLSAERIRRKYTAEITTDPEVFQTCTDTIIRHVEDIGRMVDEFSAFARMPTPVMKQHELRELCRQTVFLQSSGRQEIRYLQQLPDQPVVAECDARQIAQALTNLLKNAVEAIEGRVQSPDGIALPQGEIQVLLRFTDTHVELMVADNGKGLPVEERDRLTEPYVTTRSKGTGLGLAIVKKIMEDHHGTLQLMDRVGGGASVSLQWPRRQPQTDAETLPSNGKSDKSDFAKPILVARGNRG